MQILATQPWKELYHSAKKKIKEHQEISMANDSNDGFQLYFKTSFVDQNQFLRFFRKPTQFKMSKILSQLIKT